MSLPPRFMNVHNGTTGMPDALSPYGSEPAGPAAVGIHSAGVVLFDPETDTSPYAAKHKKPKNSPAEKPAVKASARAAAIKMAERAQRAATSPRTAAPAAAPEPAVHPAPTALTAPAAPAPEGHHSPRRIAGHQHAQDSGSNASVPVQRGPLRIVSNDPNEIRRYAEAQRRSEGALATPAAASPRTPAQTPMAPVASAPSAADELERAAVEFATSSMPAVSTVVPDPTEPPAPALTATAVANQLATARDALLRHLRAEHVWRLAMVWITGAACVLMTITMLYFPSQELYRAMRENERLSQELALNLERNEQMQTRVASLQTAEGIQDEATRAYGMVMPGEHAVSVVGAPYEPPATAIPAQIPRGAGENSHSWATDLLDQVFGVTSSSATLASTTSVATVTETSTETEEAAPSNADIVAQGDA